MRLGLTDINPVYFKAIKSTFRLGQTLGIIGGRPNHALYFIGNVGNDLVYLDPHRTQLVVDAESDDRTYHCSEVLRLDLKHLDPSISLCFYCHTESDFDNWCALVKRHLIIGEKQPLFELAKERQPAWPPLAQPLPVELGKDAMNMSTDSFASYDMATVGHYPNKSIDKKCDSAREAYTHLNDYERTTTLNGSDEDEDFELLG